MKKSLEWFGVARNAKVRRGVVGFGRLIEKSRDFWRSGELQEA